MMIVRFATLVVMVRESNGTIGASQSGDAHR